MIVELAVGAAVLGGAFLVYKKLVQPVATQTAPFKAVLSSPVAVTAAASTATTTQESAVSTSTDPYPNKTLAEVQAGKVAAEADKATFTAGLVFPTDSSTNPPSFATVIGPKAGQETHLMQLISSYNQSIHYKETHPA